MFVLGCRQDMQDQPKFFPQRGTDFYADGRSVRPQVENTVARGQLHEDGYFYTGLINGKEGDGLPFPGYAARCWQRGQERYNVYCTPCHSRVGNGVGMIVQRGYMKAGNFHTPRLETAPLGHFFHVISNGYGAMPDYAAQIDAGGSLGDRRLHQSAAVEPEGDAGGCAGGRTCGAAGEHRGARRSARDICRRVDAAADCGNAEHLITDFCSSGAGQLANGGY